MKLILRLCLTSTLLLSALINVNAQCDDPFPPNTGAGSAGCMLALTNVQCSEAAYDGYCSSTAPTPAGIQPQPFCGSVDNSAYLAFVATDESVIYEVTSTNCVGTAQGTGIQVEMYQTDDCFNFTSVSNCYNPGSQGTGTITSTVLCPGETYVIMIDGWAGDQCDYEFTLLSTPGPTPIPDLTGVVGSNTACPGSVLPYMVTENGSSGACGAYEYEWTIAPPLGTVIGTGNSVDIQWNIPGNANIIVTATSACGMDVVNFGPIAINPIPPTDEEYTACFGEQIICAGQNFVAVGNMTVPVILQSYQGCDSMINCIINTVPLIIIPPVEDFICEGDSYPFGTMSYDETGFYQETFMNYQGCDSTISLQLYELASEAVIVPPGVLGCGTAGGSVVLDGSGSTSLPSSPASTITYLWTTSNGGTISGPTDQFSATGTSAGDYTLTVTQSANGVDCVDSETVTVIEDNAVPDMPSVTGDAAPCANGMNTYTVIPAGTGPAATSFTWTVVGGTFVDNGNTIDVTWGAAGAGSVCVTANNDCGSSMDGCLQINVNAGPVDPTITGLSDVCEGTMGTYTVTNAVAGDTYSWTISGGATITSTGTNSANVNFSGATTASICATASNLCGSSMEVCFPFTITNLPAQPTISGSQSVCNGSMETYTVPVDANVDSYVWTTPNGEPFVMAGANGITVDWTNSPGGLVCATAVNSCGNSLQNCFNVTVNAAPTATLSGGGAFCTGSGDIIDLNVDLTGSGPWILTYNDGTMDVVANPAATPFVINATTAGNYTLVSLTDQTPCPGIVNGDATVTENPLPTAMISGTGAICENSGDCVSLNVELTGTANWTIVVAIDNIDQAPITGIMSSPFVYDACQAGTYTIVSVTDANMCSAAGTGSSVVTENTAVLATNIMTACNATNTAYTVTFEITGGDPASYTVNGATTGIVAGVFTSAEIPSGDAYSFTVDDANSCNPQLVENLNGVLCDCTTAVGTMDATAIDLCGDGCMTPVYDNTNEAFDANDALQFILHEGSGLSIVNEIARNATAEFCFDGTTMTYGTTYYISAVVGDDMGAGVVDLTDGCLAVAQGTAVTWFEIPTGTLSGSPIVCEGDMAMFNIDFTGPGPFTVIYEVAGTPDTLNGIVANPYVLEITPAATVQVCLTEVSNANCPGVADGCGMATVNGTPMAINIQTTCNATATEYVVTFEITGGDPATYMVDGSTANISAGPPYIFTSAPQVPLTTYSFVLTDGNACGQDEISTAVPVICDCNTEVGVLDISNPIGECGDGPVDIANLYDNTNEELDSDDITLWVLHDAQFGLGNVIQSNTTGAFTFDAASMTYGTQYFICYAIGNDDGTGNVDPNDPCIAVSEALPITYFEVPTVTMSGNSDICMGEDGMIDLVFTGDAPWSVTVEDGNGFSETVTDINANNFTFIVTAPTTTATYTPTLVNDENCPGTVSGSATISVNEAPTAENLVVTFNASNTAYTVCFDIMGGTAPYTVTGNTGMITGTQFCSDPIPCGQGYLFNLDDGFMCGPTVVEQATVICSCLTEVGALTTPVMGDTLKACGSEVLTANYDALTEMLDANDVVDFMIHNGDNVAITTGATPDFSYSPLLNYGQVYYMSARAGDDNGVGGVSAADPCLSLTDPATSVPVIFFQEPVATLGGTGAICNGASIDLDVAIVGGIAPWTVTVDDGNGGMLDFVIMMANESITLTPTQTTIYTLTAVNDANCTGSANGSAVVTVNTAPQATNITETSDMASTFYTVCFDISGGDMATYEVTGMSGTITGNQFCSDPIPCDPTGSMYSFTLTDANDCAPVLIEDVFVCNCITMAGTMDLAPVSVCENDMATVTATMNEMLDANDVLLYYLHDNGLNSLGTVIATNATPEFSFDAAAMQCGTEYFISAVVGSDDGSGGIDLTDPCLDVSFGTPITFECLPTAMLNAPAALCEGSTGQLDFTLTGAAPFDVVIELNAIPQMITINANTGTFPIDTDNGEITYTLVSVTDDNGCTALIGQSETVTISMQPDAGTALAAAEFCEGATDTQSLAGLLMDADAGGTWTANGTADGFNPASGTVNVVQLTEGTYTYTYTLSATAPCTDATTVVQIEINTTPVADAGDDQTLTCNQTSVAVGGPNTTTGLSYIYEWTFGGMVVGNDITLDDATTEGIYTLTVSNPQTGCTDSDDVLVSLDIDQPTCELVVDDIDCFGDGNGSIFLTNLAGGTPPYECSINGSDFTSEKEFFNLGPGDYLIVLRDANGCEVVKDIANIAEPEELTVTITGAFPGEDEDNNTIVLGDDLLLTIEISPTIDPLNLENYTLTPAELFMCGDTCDQLQYLLDSLMNTTTIGVEIEDDGGCRASDQLEIIVDKNIQVYVPNAFGPSAADPLNQTLKIFTGKNVASINSFQVFNRWGESMFQAFNFSPDDPVGSWDGTHKGQMMNAAVYIWWAEVTFIDGHVELFKGDVVLMK